MRSPLPYHYVIDKIPPVPEVLRFIQEEAGLNNREAYSTFNMGAGFAIFVHVSDENKLLDVIHDVGFEGFIAGIVEPSPNGRKKLIINPKNLTYSDRALNIR